VNQETPPARSAGARPEGSVSSEPSYTSPIGNAVPRRVAICGKQTMAALAAATTGSMRIGVSFRFNAGRT